MYACIGGAFVKFTPNVTVWPGTRFVSAHVVSPHWIPTKLVELGGAELKCGALLVRTWNRISDMKNRLVDRTRTRMTVRVLEQDSVSVSSLIVQLLKRFLIT